MGSNWRQFCLGFNTKLQQLSATEPRFPDFCSPSDIPTAKDIATMTQNINLLRGKIAATNPYSGTTADSDTVKDAMKTFCCAMESRISLQNRFEAAKQDYEIAKQRVESIRYPAKDLSYLGTVVPFGRPLRPDSVPLLMGASIVFVILSLALLLGLGNIHLMYAAPGGGSTIGNFIRGLIDSYRQTSRTLLLITIAISAAAAGGIYYGIQKQRPEWLGLKPIE